MTDAQRTPAWHAARKNLVTGSSVGAILGYDPYRTREDVMRAMVRAREGLPTEFTGNVATEWGVANEAGALVEYTMETGRRVTPAPFVVHHEHPWLGASPDGYVGNDGLVEVKCPYKHRAAPAPVPFAAAASQEHYCAQMQIQMACTGTNWCDFWQWAPNGTTLERVPISQEFLSWAIPALREFYEEFLAEDAGDHVLPKLPEIDSIRARQMVEEYRGYKEAEDRAAERAKDILAEIAAMAGGSALFGGAKLTKVEKAGSVSYAKVVAAKLPGLDLTPWTGKPSSYWKLT